MISVFIAQYFTISFKNAYVLSFDESWRFMKIVRFYLFTGDTTQAHTHTHIYIYIYRERERETDRQPVRDRNWDCQTDLEFL